MATGTTLRDTKSRRETVQELRILLIGRTGSGKSSTGNSILGYDDKDSAAFRVSGSSQSCTNTTHMKEEDRFGYRITVVDTPGLFDTRREENEIRKELLKALATSTPGFHVIAYVLKPEKYTEEMKRTQKLFFEWFGDGVEKHALVVLTNTDSNDKMREYLSDKDHELSELIRRCNEIILPIDNKGTPEKKQVQLQDLITKMIQIKKDLGYFTNIRYQFAEIYARSKSLEDLKKDSIRYLEQSGLWSGHMPSVSPRGNVQIFDAKTGEPISRPSLESMLVLHEPDFSDDDAVDGNKGREDERLDSDKTEQNTTASSAKVYCRPSKDNADIQSSFSDDAESSIKRKSSRRNRIFNKDIKPSQSNMNTGSSNTNRDVSVDIDDVDSNVGSDAVVASESDQLIDNKERNRNFRHNMNSEKKLNLFARIHNWFMRLVDFLRGRSH